MTLPYPFRCPYLFPILMAFSTRRPFLFFRNQQRFAGILGVVAENSLPSYFFFGRGSFGGHRLLKPRDPQLFRRSLTRLPPWSPASLPSMTLLGKNNNFFFFFGFSLLRPALTFGSSLGGLGLHSRAAFFWPFFLVKPEDLLVGPSLHVFSLNWRILFRSGLGHYRWWTTSVFPKFASCIANQIGPPPP